jgi:hypothetical protein
MSRESRLRRTPSCAARPIAYVAPARSMTTTNKAATATGYGQPLQKSTGESLGRERRLRAFDSRAAWDTDARRRGGALRFERRSRAADDRRNDEQSAMQNCRSTPNDIGALRGTTTTSALQRDVREKRPKLALRASLTIGGVGALRRATTTSASGATHENAQEIGGCQSSRYAKRAPV